MVLTQSFSLHASILDRLSGNSNSKIIEKAVCVVLFSSNLVLLKFLLAVNVNPFEILYNDHLIRIAIDLHIIP